MRLDLQVNGFAGVDFNQPDVSPEDLHRACQALRDGGAGRILATVITHDADRMCATLRRLAALRAADPLAAGVIAGFHIEGPFLNPAPGFIGAHPAAHARPADPGLAARLLDAGGGWVRVFTLAPEQDPGGATLRRLVDAGVVVAAGHSDASRDQLRAALDAGLALFTHLGNGCPADLPRHDNIVQRVLSLAADLHISFIADGAHIPFFALGNYLRLVPPERVILVSDTIAAAGLGPGEYTLGDRRVRVGADGVPRSADGSHLVGSGCPLPEMEARLARELGLTPAQVHPWTHRNPARLLGLENPP